MMWSAIMSARNAEGSFQDGFGNTQIGIFIGHAHHNRIGGETDLPGTGPGNTILGNGQFGLLIREADAQANVIQGNLIARSGEHGN